jgi:two-component system CheB/CheR fusion protein
MAIRRFTPAAERLLNVIPGDVGRPIGQIKPNLMLQNLETLIWATIDGVGSQEQEVQDGDGRWYLLRVKAYKSVDNRLDGAVVAAFDIDHSKRYQRQVERARDYFMKIVEMVNQPQIVLDSDLRVRTANGSFCDTFGLTRSQAEGMPFLALDGGRWDRPEIRTLLEAASAGDASQRIQMDQRLDGSPAGKHLLINARGFELDDQGRWILLAMELVDAEQTG